MVSPGDIPKFIVHSLPDRAGADAPCFTWNTSASHGRSRRELVRSVSRETRHIFVGPVCYSAGIHLSRHGSCEKPNQKDRVLAHILAIANQKGGVGKTTTAVNLSAALALANKSVLLVDVDPQANAGSGLGIVPEDDSECVYEVLLGASGVDAIIRETEVDGLSVIPSAPRLTGAEVELVPLRDRESRLREALASVSSNYDYILIDTPPSLGLLTLNALVAAESVLITTQCEYYALEGMSNLNETIEMVRSSLNERLRILGVLLTMYDARLNLSQQVAAEARNVFGRMVFETVIPRNVRLSEAPSFGKPIMLYDAFSTGASAYIALAKEIIERDQEGAR